MSLCLSCWFRWMLSFLFLLLLLSLSAFPFASEENTKYKTIAFSFVWLRADEDATCLKFRERCSRPFSLLLVYIFWCPCFARARVCVCVCECLVAKLNDLLGWARNGAIPPMWGLYRISSYLRRSCHPAPQWFRFTSRLPDFQVAGGMLTCRRPSLLSQ